MEMGMESAKLSKHEEGNTMRSAREQLIATFLFENSVQQMRKNISIIHPLYIQAYPCRVSEELVPTSRSHWAGDMVHVLEGCQSIPRQHKDTQDKQQYIHALTSRSSLERLIKSLFMFLTYGRKSEHPEGTQEYMHTPWIKDLK
ncbi:hypothetical protein XENORESO_006844 [Xenotaenia resolanae]|uniref:Uncharacterized protein n=1 Tax=Xenotaenia resolanae TaxID=208358 RepID=A0ABV0VVF1_9TELE